MVKENQDEIKKARKRIEEGDIPDWFLMQCMEVFDDYKKIKKPEDRWQQEIRPLIENVLERFAEENKYPIFLNEYNDYDFSVRIVADETLSIDKNDSEILIIFFLADQVLMKTSENGNVELELTFASSGNGLILRWL